MHERQNEPVIRESFVAVAPTATTVGAHFILRPYLKISLLLSSRRSDINYAPNYGQINNRVWHGFLRFLSQQLDKFIWWTMNITLLKASQPRYRIIP